MVVSAVDLKTCGTCNHQPLINILSSDNPTLFGDIKVGTTTKTNLARGLIDTINKLNQNAYVTRDKVL